MSDNEPRERLEPRSSVPGTIVFERMAARLSRSARLYRRSALLLAAGGAVLLALGAFAGQAAALAAGGMALAVAVLPWLGAVELAERADGLAVLGEDWAEPGPAELAGRRRAGLIDLVERLYAPERSG